MKKFGLCLLLLLIIGGGVGGYFYIKDMHEKDRIEEIKKGWYIEITYKEPINVRESTDTQSKSLGQVNKGEVYKVLEIDTSKKTFYWYKIDFDGKEGWVASGKKIHWVKDVNNPNDIAVPEIKFDSDDYYVNSIRDINYRHLEIIEDTENYEITHKIYHEVKPEENIDQYWILYTIVDGAGKSSSKTQRIIFAEKPDESLVEDFSNYKR